MESGAEMIMVSHRSQLVVVDKSVGETVGSGLSFATSLSVLAEQSEIREANSSHMSAHAP